MRILKSWWPLAASWILMSVANPGVSAIIARLPDPEINLAAYGGIAHPVSLIIESPIIMMLSASTTLNRDWKTYKRLFRFMIAIGLALTLVHFLFSFTPLYYVMAEGLIGIPAEVVEPARLGMIYMLPWTMSIVYRKFHQGILIRYGHSKTIASGTVIRVMAIAVGMLVAANLTDLPGVAIGSVGHSCGVFFEALYTHFRARPVIQNQLRYEPEVEKLKWVDFARFYIPLALTPLISYGWQPIGSAAISRMPNPVESLAAWSVVSGLLLILNSTGMSYNEIVVALLDKKGSYPVLKRFTKMMVGIAFGIALIIAITPLADFYFQKLVSVSAQLSTTARQGFWFLVLAPAMMYAQSFFQGIILNSRKTRSIPEAMVIFLVISISVLGVGTVYGQVAGVYVTAAAYALAITGQVSWMWYRSRPAARNLTLRDGPQAQAV